jgi:hypothetical protein
VRSNTRNTPRPRPLRTSGRKRRGADTRARKTRPSTTITTQKPSNSDHQLAGTVRRKSAGGIPRVQWSSRVWLPTSHATILGPPKFEIFCGNVKQQLSGSGAQVDSRGRAPLKSKRGLDEAPDENVRVLQRRTLPRMLRACVVHIPGIHGRRCGQQRGPLLI